MKTFIAVAAALVAGSLTVTAHATAVRDAREQVVSYADLNLQSATDAAILLGRIKSAARKVCGMPRASLIPMELVQHLAACVDAATARAVDDVGAPLLTQHRQIVVQNVQ